MGMPQGLAEVIASDVRRLGFVASYVPDGNGLSVRIATPYGTERISSLEQWAAHAARGLSQTPLDAQEYAKLVVKHPS